MKSYTDLEQSKKLAEILPPESADMCYKAYKEEGGIPDYQVTLCPYQFASWIGIPCWSLAALLDLLPNKFNVEAIAFNKLKNSDYLDKCTKTLYWFNNTWHCDYMDEDFESEISMSADNPVDACVKMFFELKRLIDNNLL